MPSPACEVKDGAGSYQATTNGVNVTPTNTVTIHLIDTSADVWSIACVYTDDTSDAAAVTASLTIDSALRTATFTAPAAGKTYIFQSKVNNGVGVDGRVKSSYSTTFGVYTLTSGGSRVIAANETTEGGAFGWTKPVNDALRTGLGGSNGSIDTTNTTVKQGYKELDTTDATPTTVTFKDAAGGADFSSFALPNNGKVRVDLQVETVQSGGSKSKSFTVRRSFIIDGSSTVTAGSQVNLIDPDEMGGTMSCSVVIDYTGTNARVDWTGIAGTTMRTRFDVEITTVTGQVFSGSAPTTTAINPAIADPAGGSSHVITGTGYTGATSVTVGGTAVTSFVVDSDTQITAVLAAHASGANLSVVVTNPSGSNGANTLFEYWAPEDEALTLFHDKIKSPYTGPATPCTWAGVASAGSSGGRDAGQTTGGFQPAVSGGAPDPDGTTKFLTNAATMANLFGSAQGTILFVWVADTLAAPGSLIDEASIFADNGSYLGVVVNSSGLLAFVLDTGGTRISTTATAAGTGTVRVGMARWDGTNLKVSLGSSIDIQSVPCLNLNAAASGGAANIGANYTGANTLDGRILTLATLDGAIGDATYTKFRKWAQAARGAA